MQDKRQVAGSILIQRNNIKGRDWYDLIWFVKAGVPCDSHYLQNKMIQTGHLKTDQILSEEMFHQLLRDKISVRPWQFLPADFYQIIF